jgi:ABC-type ATPase with predicted acetyltransferase domain
MTKPSITVVAGLSGSGKTNWICQQIRDIKSLQKVIYFSPGTGNIIIDQTCIANEFPGIQVFSDGQEIEFLHQIPQAKEVYI